MIRRLLVLAVLTLPLIWLLTRLVPGPTPLPGAPAARAQEPLPVPPSPYPQPRDPAQVSSELFPDPTDLPPEVIKVPPARRTGTGYVQDVGAAAAELRRQVTRLKADATTDLRGDARRQLSGKADEVLDALDDFDARLAMGRPRAALAEDYMSVQARLAALTRDARAAGLGGAPTRERAGWVAMAGERLAEAVAEGSGPAAWDPALVARESDNLVFQARALERAGEYSLSTAPGRRDLQRDLHFLTDASEYFRASVAQENPRVRLMRDFASVEEVWERVEPAVAGLTRAERLPLVTRASSVEDVILGLHRRLGMAGAPAHLPAEAEPRQTAPSQATFRPYGLVLPASAPR